MIEAMLECTLQLMEAPDHLGLQVCTHGDHSRLGAGLGLMDGTNQLLTQLVTANRLALCWIHGPRSCCCLQSSHAPLQDVGLTHNRGHPAIQLCEELL